MQLGNTSEGKHRHHLERLGHPGIHLQWHWSDLLHHRSRPSIVHPLHCCMKCHNCLLLRPRSRMFRDKSHLDHKSKCPGVLLEREKTNFSLWFFESVKGNLGKHSISTQGHCWRDSNKSWGPHPRTGSNSSQVRDRQQESGNKWSPKR